MAEKKVSGKTKNKDNKTTRDSSYDDFLAQYGSELRKRSTRTVTEPVRKKENINTEESRCGEIDPHTTVNPAVDHQIFTKRTGRILSDDTGFKAKNYHQRFELTPEMPEIRDNDSQEELMFNTIPGQQTMADMVSDNTQGEISVPIEGQISDNEQDLFATTYKAFRNDTPLSFGKSEKLRAIARTAADDAGMEPESQLSFPAFDPLFKFPEEKSGKKKLKIKKNSKKEKTKNQEKQFDIDEKDIVTKSVQEEQKDIDSAPDLERNTEIQDKKSRFFEFLADTGSSQEVEAPFEINDKNEIRNVLKILTKQSHTALIKSLGMLVSGIILMILLLVIDENKTTLHSVLSFIFLLISGAICVKELSDGIKDSFKKKLTLNSGVLLIYISVMLQTIISFFSVSDGSILAPAAIIVMTAVTLPKFLLSNNSKLTAGMFTAGRVSVFRTASESGIDGVISEKFTNGNGKLRYASGTLFATGLMKKLTNAVPKPFGVNAAYIMVIAFAFIAGIASGFISSSVMDGMTVFTGMLITCLPVTFSFTSAVLLYNTNNALSKNNSSLISYRCAAELTETKAIIFNTSDIIEQSACSIHGVKAFGNIDPQKATIYCAAAINAGLSPLTHIMKQVTDQNETEVPEAQDVEIFSSGGIKATVENSSVFLGSREFLEDNGIYIPKEDYDAKFLTGDRKLLYFAMDGKFTMLLIVSYHIKRSVAAFFKYLTSHGIKPVIHSSDPNITPSYIIKKCKLEQDSVFETENAEASYFADKEKRTEPALPADVFTNGSMVALSDLIRNAFTLNKTINILPFIIYMMSAICAVLIAAPVFLGSAASIGNVYIIILRVLCFAVSIIALKFLSKQK